MERRFIDRITPLFLLFTVYGLAWIDLFLPHPSLAAFSPSWFALLAAKGVFRIILILLAMKFWLGLEEFRFEASGVFPSAKDLANGILVAATAGLLALGIAALAFFAGATNPLLYPLSSGVKSPIALLLMALSSIGVGYSEELFFRFFAVTAFEKSGFPPAIAVLASALLFGVSHGSQGIFGMVGTGLLAFLFSYFRTKGKGLHALSIGHALYDFAILLAVS